jgi:hypothetical protein
MWAGCESPTVLSGIPTCTYRYMWHRGPGAPRCSALAADPAGPSRRVTNRRVLLTCLDEDTVLSLLSST